MKQIKVFTPVFTPVNSYQTLEDKVNAFLAEHRSTAVYVVPSAHAWEFTVIVEYEVEPGYRENAR